jgi:hypothetical protein
MDADPDGAPHDSHGQNFDTSAVDSEGSFSNRALC